MIGQSSTSSGKFKSHPEAHMVLVTTTSSCKYADNNVYSVNERPRPTQLTQDPEEEFSDNAVYMEFAYNNRYEAKSLEGRHIEPDNHGGYRHLAETAKVDLGKRKFQSAQFQEYRRNKNYCEIANNNNGGRIYFLVRGTKLIQYADLKPMN